MAFNLIENGLKDDSGAVAPIYALALTGLVAMAGIGYDVGQVLTMDSELQAAADQAALAAVTQLDRQAGAINRAKSAARDLIANNTLIAGDAGQVELPADDAEAFEFYATRDDAEAGNNQVNDDARARFVKINIEPRSARYALTPIGSAVASWTSPEIGAAATAGMGSAICKVPPLKICNPQEGTDPSFNVDNYIGKGLILDTTGGTNNGKVQVKFLELTGTGNSASAYIASLAWITPTGDCLGEEELRNDGNAAGAALNIGLNTRFDIYDDSGSSTKSCPAGGAPGEACSPSANVVKDLAIKTGTTFTGSGNACGFGANGNNAQWYWPSSAYGYVPGTTTLKTGITAMGLPRDKCHVNGLFSGCSGGVGSGDWDISTYLAVHYGNPDYAALGITKPSNLSIPRRYDVYKWELDHKGQSVTYGGTTYSVLGSRIVQTQGNGKNAQTFSTYGAAQCKAPGITPSTSGIDRRVFPVAVVNCNSTNPKAVIKWVNMFLVEPSIDRQSVATNTYQTSKNDIYMEVVSVSQPGSSDGGNGNVIRRDKPYLIK